MELGTYREKRDSRRTAGPRGGRARRRATRSAPGEAGETQVAGVRLTHPERVLYPEMGVTKRELASYYVAVAEHVLPHVVERPLTLVRCPRGAGGACFYQKHLGELPAEHLRGVAVGERGGRATYVAIRDLAGLVQLVQLGVLEIDPWGSRADRLERPDRIVLDIDPDARVEFRAVIDTARLLRASLEQLGLASFVRTSGGKGLHVVVPIERRSSWDEVKAFAHGLVRALERSAPDRYLTSASKAKRRGRIFLDYLRNDRGATAIASYSSRARAGAPVATPLAWDELVPGLDPARFDVRSVPRRLARRGGDPWRGFLATRQSLTAAMRAAVAELRTT